MATGEAGDALPSACGAGVPVYRSEAWIKWAGEREMLPFHVEQNDSKEETPDAV